MNLKGWYGKLMPPSRYLERFFTKPAMGEQICIDCGHTGVPQRTKRGSDDLELGLWATLVASTVFYVGIHLAWWLFWTLLHVHLPGLVIRGFSLLTRLLFVLGAVYTIWRISTEYLACPKCQHETMIPLDTPRGQKAKAELQPPSKK